MASTDDLYAAFLAHWRQGALLKSVSNLLSWDQSAFCPPGGSEHRAEQMGVMASLAHDTFTSPRLGDMIADLETRNDLGPSEGARQANVREARRVYDRQTRLPKRLVEELARVTALSQNEWVEARKRSDFKRFLPWLEQMISLKREEAAVLSAGSGKLYDALMDEYERGATAAAVAQVFGKLRSELVELVQAIRNSGRTPNISILTRHYPQPAQYEFARAAAEQIGFNFKNGRLDQSAHPFCEGIGPGDCRLTTRYDEHHFPGAFFGVLHEAGHGIYEQGLDRAAFGSPIGNSASLGIHESQSRMWENFVGRSPAFWTHFFPAAQRAFPEALGGVALDAFFAAINDVRPSLIRVESDEATYNLHIMLRFELEQALIEGRLRPADVPAAWKEAYQTSLGITPANDAEGCLQDIHWSMGLIGYFPTYALGNMYAAQLFDKARLDLGDLDAQFAKGEFTPLREWLNQNVHRFGRQYTPAHLIERVTDRPLSHEPLMAHLRAKFGSLYRLS